MRAVVRRWGLAVGLLVVGLGSPLVAGKEDRPAQSLMTKTPANSGQRDVAVPGYLELSDGTVRYGRLFVARDKRLTIREIGASANQPPREIPLQVVRAIDCKVKREQRIRELARDKKTYTGKSYPVQEYEHSITLRDGRKITGDLSGILYVIPGELASPQVGATDPERYLFHKRQKGDVGQTFKHLIYVKTVRLGDEALREGKRKGK
jgi:hypothetical protein